MYLPRGISFVSEKEAVGKGDRAMKTLIKNTRIVEGTGVIRENAGILFDESGILAVGEERTEKADTVIDGTGRTVLPGLIDCHVHLGLGALNKIGKPEEQAASMLMQFRELINHGITTVRSMSTAEDCDIKLKQYLNTFVMSAQRQALHL